MAVEGGQPEGRHSCLPLLEWQVATSVGPLFADYPRHVADVGWLAKFWPGKH